MEIYSWGKIGSNYQFTLWILEHQPIFGNQDMIESVELHLTNFISYETTKGREFAHNYFKDMTSDNISYFITEYEYMKSEFSYELTGKDFDDFKWWLLTSLTPKIKQRKQKIDRIIKKSVWNNIL